MGINEILILLFFGLYGTSSVLKGFYEVYYKNNPYGLSKLFRPIGSFVWADAIIFGAFFTIVSTLTLILQDFLLFLVILSVFWTIRSIGEMIYWIMEQFASQHKNPEHTIWFSKIYTRNSSFIAMQIFWQCITVISIVVSVYLFKIWLN